MRGVRALGVLVSIASLWACASTVVAINGRFPAAYPQAAELRKISVANFDGRGGSEFTSNLKSAIVSASFDRQAYFVVVESDPAIYRKDPAAAARRSGAQGLLMGETTLTASQQTFPSSQRVCVAREGDKCTKYVSQPISCTQRIVQLTVTPRLVRASDGQIVYSSSKSEQASVSWCPGQSPSRTDEMMFAATRSQITAEILRDIAPYNAVLSATIKESPEGLPKDAADQFKAAIAAVKAEDIGEACRLWTAIDGTNPNHVWTVYDLGVCAETQGDYAKAQSLYRRAQTLGAAADGDVSRSIARVVRLTGAESQLTAEESERKATADAAERQRTELAAAAERQRLEASRAEASRVAEEARRASETQAARRANLTAKFGAQAATAILAGQINRGMTREQVLASRGNPTSRETISPSEEMWKYGNQRVVFSDGKVTFVSQ